MRENILKAQIEEYLFVKHLFYLRLNSGDIVKGYGKSRRRIRLCPEGTADFIVIQTVKSCTISQLKVIWIEAKGEGTEWTEEQKLFALDVVDRGMSYYVVETVEQVQNIFERG